MQLAAIYPLNSSQDNLISEDKLEHYFKQECCTNQGTMQIVLKCCLTMQVRGKQEN